MKAYVQIVYITCSSHGQSLDGLNVSVEISPKLSMNDETVNFPLKDLDLLTNKSTLHFNIQQIETQFLSICILEDKDGAPVPIASLNAPLSSFPNGQAIKGQFKMNPTSFGSHSFTILLDVFISNSKLLNLDPNVPASSNANYKKHLINKSILQSKHLTPPTATNAQPRILSDSTNRSPKSRPYSLPISTFSTFQEGDASFSTQSDMNDRNSYVSSSSSIDSVELDLSESSDDNINAHNKGEDESSSSYLSESSNSTEDKGSNLNENRSAAVAESPLGKSSDPNGENSQESTDKPKKKHKHRHRHHHHHHKHHEHRHDDRTHHHRRSHHHHSHSHRKDSDQDQQNDQQSASIQKSHRRTQLCELSIGSQRILRPQIRSIASDRNIHKKRAFIGQRQSTLNLPTIKDQTCSPEDSNLIEGQSRILRRGLPANSQRDNPFL